MIRVVIRNSGFYFRDNIKCRSAQMVRFLSTTRSENIYPSNKLQYLGIVYSRAPIRLFSTSKVQDTRDGVEEANGSTGPDETPKDDKEKAQLIRRIAQEDDDYYDDYEGGEGRSGYKKYLSYFMLTTIGGLVLYASYSIAVELFGRGAPGHLYDETFEIVRVNDEVRPQ